jgi:large subunit ribosomal protein L10
MKAAALNKNMPKKGNVKAKKARLLGEFAEKTTRAKAMVFTDYQGMTHHQLEDLKKAVRKLDAEFVITKNTLIARAVSSTVNGLQSTVDGSQWTESSFKEKFSRPTATLFAYNDVVLPLKEIVKTAKTLKLPTIKFGVFEGKLLEEKDVTRLSTLPSKEVLLGQLVGSMKSPIYGLHRALSWNMQKFVMTLSAIQQKKS